MVVDFRSRLRDVAYKFRAGSGERGALPESVVDTYLDRKQN